MSVCPILDRFYRQKAQIKHISSLQIYFVNGGSPSTSTYRRLKRKSLNRHFSPTSKVRNSVDIYSGIAAREECAYAALHIFVS